MSNLSKRVIQVSVGQRFVKLWKIQFFEATLFAILCSGLLLIRSGAAFDPTCSFAGLWSTKTYSASLERSNIYQTCKKVKGLLGVGYFMTS